MSKLVLTNFKAVGRYPSRSLIDLTIIPKVQSVGRYSSRPPIVLTNVASRLYSSSSSSSSSTKKNNTTSSSSNTKNDTTPTAPQKQELSFVHVSHIHPREIAQSTFFAGDRPLLTYDSEQMQQSGQNKQTLDEEDYEEENSGSNVNSILLNNPLSPYLIPSPFHHTQPTISLSSTELQYIVNRFLSKIELKNKQNQLTESLNERMITVKGSEVDNVKQKEQSVTVNYKRKRDKTIYCTNIVQKRRLKMKKHKLRKLRKRDRSLNKKLGKI